MVIYSSRVIKELVEVSGGDRYTALIMLSGICSIAPGTLIASNPDSQDVRSSIPLLPL